MWAFFSRRLRIWLLLAIALPLTRAFVHRLDRFDEDFAAGVRLNRQQAIAAVRDPRSTGTAAS